MKDSNSIRLVVSGPDTRNEEQSFAFELSGLASYDCKEGSEIGVALLKSEDLAIYDKGDDWGSISFQYRSRKIHIKDDSHCGAVCDSYDGIYEKQLN